MKKRFPLTLLLVLSFLGAEVLLSFGTPLVWLLSISAGEVLGYIALILFESAGLLLLLFALGSAFGALARRGMKAALLLLSGTVGAHLIGTLLALIWQALFFRQAISERELLLMLGASLDNAILPLFVSFFIAYGCILKKAPAGEPRDMRDTASAPVRAVILSSSLIFAYRLIGQVVSAVQFVSEAFGFLFLKPGEKVMLFLDFIPVLAVSVGGYFLMLLARRLYLGLCAVQDGTRDTESKKTPK